MLGSFKFKLVGTFLALSVLPLAAAFWGFSQVAERSVTTSADDRLAAGITAALAAFEDERQNAERAAAELGGTKTFQTAVARGDLAAIRSLIASSPELRVETAGITIGRVPPLAAETTVSLVGPDNRSATIVASVPLNDALARKLHARSGLTAPDELAIVGRNGRISAASTATLRGSIDVTPGRVATSTIGTHSFRALGAPLVPDSSVQLAALTPIGCDRVREAKPDRPAAARPRRLTAPDRGRRVRRRPFDRWFAGAAR